MNHTHPLTIAVHAGNQGDPSTGAIQMPIVMSNPYALPADSFDIPDDPDYLIYAREAGANQVALQRKIAALDGAEDAAVFASGMGALSGVFFTFLSQGDHAVVAGTTYGAVWRLFADLLPAKMGVEVSVVDITDLNAVRAAVRPNTKLIHTEVIANPTLDVADIGALAEIAHGVGALLTVDATFAPPPMFRSLSHGADLSIHSLTKYINGHGDAMGGSVAGEGTLIAQLKRTALVHLGSVIAPMNAWLISRGSITLPQRLAQQVASAQAIASYLDDHPAVVHVSYPGLPDHPQHEAARRQFGDYGYGGMIAFVIEGDHATRNRFVGSLDLITSAVSLGHDESLIVYEAAEAEREEWFPEALRGLGLMRLSVGLEDPRDLIADLERALAGVLSR